MDSDQYRVVLTGDMVPGFSREAVIAALARLFETSAGQLVDVLDGAEYVIDDPLSAEDASRLQRRVEAIGARAKVEPVDSPSTASASLRLPQRDDATAAGLMRCPACGHRQLVAKRCDECGVVFADFNRGRFSAPQPPSKPVGTGERRRTVIEGRRPHVTARTSDIHAREANGWNNQWVDEGDEIPTEQFHINLFMGRGGVELATVCKKMALGPRTLFSLSWAGAAVISPFLWAMYRKMWGWGALIFVAEILLPVLLITLGNKDNISDKLIWLGIAGIVLNRLFWPLILKYLYCRHARKVIAMMNRMSSTHASDVDIATSGGTSRTSVFVGIVMAIVVSLLSWSLVDTIHAGLTEPDAAFAPPPDLSLGQGGLAPTDGPALPGENKWVSTRNKLRVLGQRLSFWLNSAGPEIDPKELTMAEIGQTLLLDFDSMTDDWGKQISYRFEGNGFALISAGADGVFDTSDDLEYRRSLTR